MLCEIVDACVVDSNNECNFFFFFFLRHVSRVGASLADVSALCHHRRRRRRGEITQVVQSLFDT